MYKVLITNHFKRQLKGLAKKDANLKDVLTNKLLNFSKNQAIHTGSGIYKIRLARSGQGKSGGYRLYVYMFEIEGYLTPICIHAKNKRELIKLHETLEHLSKVKEEVRLMVN